MTKDGIPVDKRTSSVAVTCRTDSGPIELFSACYPAEELGREPLVVGLPWPLNSQLLREIRSRCDKGVEQHGSLIIEVDHKDLCRMAGYADHEFAAAISDLQAMCSATITVEIRVPRGNACLARQIGRPLIRGYSIVPGAVDQHHTVEIQISASYVKEEAAGSLVLTETPIALHIP